VKRAVFIGRFQPFHKGHLHGLKDILEKVDEIVIVLGSSQYSHELDNPFTTGERITMIRQALEKEGLQPTRYWIVPIPDLHVHMIWVAQVVGYAPRFDVVYTNEPLTRRLFMEAGFEVEPVAFHKRRVYSASEIRTRMLRNEDWEELVPESIVGFIKEVDGVKRVQDLSKTDKVS
jgi:nicotinamide-nucleotide adenylyltransferase